MFINSNMDQSELIKQGSATLLKAQLLVMREARLGCNAFGMCLLRTKTLVAAVLQTKTPQNGGITCHHGILKVDYADL